MKKKKLVQEGPNKVDNKLGKLIADGKFDKVKVKKKKGFVKRR